MSSDRDPHSPEARIEAPHSPEGIGRVMRAAQAFAEAVAMPPETARRFRLVVEELVTNSVEHGGAPPEAPLRLVLAQAPGGIAIELDDAGRAFDPRTDLPPDRPPVGGFGWALILAYSRLESVAREGGRNRLRLLFHGSPPAGAG